MIMSKPIVDIIIPNYNKGDYLEECLDSVLNQTYKNWRVYLIDDYSDDHSKKILNKYFIRPLLEPYGTFYLSSCCGP